MKLYFKLFILYFAFACGASDEDTAGDNSRPSDSNTSSSTASTSSSSTGSSTDASGSTGSGSVTSGSTTAGTATSGSTTGNSTASSTASGSTTSSSTTSGSTTSSSTSSGSTTSGSTTAGSTTSGSTTSSSTTSSTTSGSTTSSSTTSGSTTSSSTTSGSTTSSSATSGSTTSGSTTSGSTTSSSTTSGSTTSSSTTSGSTTSSSTTSGSTTSSSTTSGSTTSSSTTSGSTTSSGTSSGSTTSGSSTAGSTTSGSTSSGSSTGSGSTYADLIISEYIEGTDGNKAIELYNGTGADLDLSLYKLQSSNQANALQLTSGQSPDLLSDGEVFVVCTDSANTDSFLKAECDQIDAGISHNGDDNYKLTKLISGSDVLIDSFGEDSDPGSEWTSTDSSGLVYASRNQSLRRLCSVTAGDTDLSDTFIIHDQYSSAPENDFTDVGKYSCSASSTTSGSTTSSGTGTASTAGGTTSSSTTSGSTTGAGTTGSTTSGGTSGSSTTGGQTAIYSDLIFTEYVEGGGYNKAIEIFNGTGNDIDLALYTIVRRNNGQSEANITFNTGTILKNGETYVLCSNNGSIDLTLKNYCDLESATINHNGDDGYRLSKFDASGLETIIDSFGNLNDPGSAWESNDSAGLTISTKDKTLRRKCSITSGDIDFTDTFEPHLEWDQFDKDTFDDVGQYICP